ncbi:MAG TPA: hypothetical protein PKE57_03045 [Cellvibrionaceae bacterium]|nr:hypothetical protein [Cellvibrionaceae bacterium]HMW46876.1 hypothetical protein [Cellvibrionaceae bacterium]HMW71838.1 hypothetical protein [Cellvibrionaceae bacterium]HMY38549.1 hypothetical protein [Marinagarivorans sp.]HNG58473.1 hypothetical protein [Cellvibrionaceae bacterium]
MTGISVEFIGGTLDEQTRTILHKEELSILGYRLQIEVQPKGDEPAFCIAVPIEWTSEQGHKAILKKILTKNPRNQ